MKMSISSQLRRDCLGFFTHIHPKAAWRDDLQEKIIAALRVNMTMQEIEKALMTGKSEERNS